MSFRDTLLQLGYVMIALGAVFATWALLTGPLGRWLGHRDATSDATPEAQTLAPEDDPRNGSNGPPP